MNDSELTSLIDELRSVAERLDFTLDVSLPPPASSDAITAVAASVGGFLPDSLVSFLNMHDGMRLFFNPNVGADDEQIRFPLLYIYGTDLLTYFKEAIAGKLTSVEFDEAHAFSTREKAYRCVPLASISLYNRQEQIMFVPDAPRARGENAIIEAEPGECQIWLSALDNEDVEIITIATSFDDFVRSAIGNAIKRMDGFRFWDTKAVWAKYGGSSPT